MFPITITLAKKRALNEVFEKCTNRKNAAQGSGVIL